MANLLYIGLPITWYYILTLGLSPGAEGVRISTSLDDVSSTFIYTYKFIDFSILLLPFLPFITGFKKIVVIVSALTFLLVSFFTVTRGATFVCLLAFLSSVYVSTFLSKKYKGGLVIFLFLAIILVIIGRNYGFDKISNTTSYFVERLNDKENFTSFRNDEQSDLFTLSTSVEIIFGRGLGGAHTFGIWSGPEGESLTHGMDMTHYGYLYLILKGGIILLIIIYGLAIHSMVKLWRYGGRYRSFSIVIFLYLFYEISIPKFYDPLYLFLLLMSIFLAIKIPKYSIKNKITLRNKVLAPNRFII